MFVIQPHVSWLAKEMAYPIRLCVSLLNLCRTGNGGYWMFFQVLIIMITIVLHLGNCSSELVK